MREPSPRIHEVFFELAVVDLEGSNGTVRQPPNRVAAVTHSPPSEVRHHPYSHCFLIASSLVYLVSGQNRQIAQALIRIDGKRL